MRRRGIWAAAGLLVLLASGCSSEPTTETEAVDQQLERVEEMLDDDPVELLKQVTQAYDRAVMRVRVTAGTPGSEEETSYTFLARGDAWRVETPTASEGEGDGVASVLAVGDDVCFDREFRPTLSVALAESYGTVDFDPKPWACTKADFGLNPLATFGFRRQDPRWRIENLTTEPGSFSAEVEQVDREPLLHVRTTGITRDGPLDPSRPTYDLWLDGDRRPVRMATDGMQWDFDYPGDLDASLAPPPAGQRGSYGYATGPGQGLAKACFYAGVCPGTWERPTLTWGDGRR